MLLQAPVGDVDAYGCLQRQAKDCAPIAVASSVMPTSTGKRSMFSSVKSGLTKMTAVFTNKSKAAFGKKVWGRHCQHPYIVTMSCRVGGSQKVCVIGGADKSRHCDQSFR